MRDHTGYYRTTALPTPPSDAGTSERETCLETITSTDYSSGFMCGKPLPCSDHSAAPPGAEAGTPDPLNQIAALLGLKLIPEESTIRPQSMSYVKPSELPGHVASLTSKREASA